MAAPNAQPAGSRPGPGTAHQHGAHEAGKPATSPHPGMDDEVSGASTGNGVAPHGTPAPSGNGKSNPLH